MFWESVLPATGVMFIVFSIIFFGIVLVSGTVMKFDREDWRPAIGVLMIILGVSFLFACFGYGVSLGSE